MSPAEQVSCHEDTCAESALLFPEVRPFRRTVGAGGERSALLVPPRTGRLRWPSPGWGVVLWCAPMVSSCASAWFPGRGDEGLLEL